MRRIADKRSIVSIDPTSRGLAFVFFERGELLDWGHRSAPREQGKVLGILDNILDGCAADLLVLEDAEAPLCRRRPRVVELLKAATRHARRRGILIIPVSRDEVRSEWHDRGVRSKEKAAASIALDFPDLAHVVPEKRKITRSEDALANIFDAITLLLHAFH